ncbi:X-ray repair cross-complementing protein 5 [Toxorhynchites rutilus septentrionalis]|uniref:X-ray repair cross-complementing protein 5 n=1 Tax=Toxorhynchites rutilus septentrionalis TaxID=329112 RepID=UPI002478EAE9|nr:X-ray repair cross-complementing protein 5 [Toxorhynchites rutilus septentrionalis]
MYWNPDYSEDEEHQEFIFGGREALIVLIDCAEYMFAERSDGNNNFRDALECVEAIMRNKIISSEKDLIGIIFYNTEHSPVLSDEFENEIGLIVPNRSAVCMPLSNTSADQIRRIINLRESDDFCDFGRQFGHSTDCNLADVLWLCSRVFTRCGYKLEQMSIILFTSNDEPHPAGSYEYQQCFVKAKDLQQLDVNIVLVPMSIDFDETKFYLELLCTVGNEDPELFRFPRFEESRQRLLNRIFRKDFKKKALSSIKLQMSEDVIVGVSIYSLSRKPRFPVKVTLARDSNETIFTKRSYVMCTVGEDGESSITPLLPGDQRKIQSVGGEKISFTANEVISMKQMLQPGLRLLGFKPFSKLSPANHLRSSLFVYPDEATINGSSILFRALYEKCLEKQKAAFCILTMRRKQPSKLVALIPQECCYDEDGEPFRHSGFRIEFIPYAADIRKLEVFERSPADVDNEQIYLFKSIAKKIKFKYHPSQFDNPVLTTLYANIEALLFDKNDLEVFDSTKTDNDRIDAKVAKFVSSINELFGEDVKEFAKKRIKDSAAGSPAAKAPKLDAVDSQFVIESIKNGKTGALLVSVLRSYLEQLDISGISKLKKAELIDLIKQHHKL